MGKATKAKSTKIKQANPEDREAKALRSIAAATGLPDAQFDPRRIKRTDTQQFPGEQRIAHETVRKLTRVEMLQRSKLLEPHEAAACKWYADACEEALETIGCTANYDGSSGGEFQSSGLHAQMLVRCASMADYALGASAIPPQYRALFEAVVCREETMSSVAELFMPDAPWATRNRRTRAMLKFCANLLHTRIAHLLQVKQARNESAPMLRDASSAEPIDQRRPIVDYLGLLIDQAAAAGRFIAEIRISGTQADMLLSEIGGNPETEEVDNFRGIPLNIRRGWQWAIMLVDGEPDLAENHELSAA